MSAPRQGTFGTRVFGPAVVGPPVGAIPGSIPPSGAQEARASSGQRGRRTYQVQRPSLAGWPQQAPAGGGWTAYSNPQRRTGQSNPAAPARAYQGYPGSRQPSARVQGPQAPQSSAPSLQGDYQGRVSGSGPRQPSAPRRSYSTRVGDGSRGRREPMNVAFPTDGGMKIFTGYGTLRPQQAHPEVPLHGRTDAEARRATREMLQAQMEQLAQLQRQREQAREQARQQKEQRERRERQERQERRERRERQARQECQDALSAPESSGQTSPDPTARHSKQHGLPPHAAPVGVPATAPASTSGPVPASASRASRDSQASRVSQTSASSQSLPYPTFGASGASGASVAPVIQAAQIAPAVPAIAAIPTIPTVPAVPAASIPRLAQHAPLRQPPNAAFAPRPAPQPQNPEIRREEEFLTPDYVLQHHKASLTAYEQAEIRQYQKVYYWGEGVKKPYSSNGGINHGFDDARGDYLGVLKDHVGYRFELVDVLGSGSFGKVFKARDHMTRKWVALKIIRNRRRFHRQGLVEVKLLETLRNNDPNDMNNCIRMHSSFYFRSHLCFVTELLSINLYELLLRTELRGLSLGLVRKFAIQVLNAFRYAQQQRIIHADVKPENILLVDPNRSGIKVIDWGSGALESETIYTYIQSRFYRAPEVILGLPYGMPIDIWSIGVMLVELYTGKPLFPGEDEVDQLGKIVEYLGMPPREMMVKSPRKAEFFIAAPSGVGMSLRSRHRPNSQALQRVLGADKEFCDFILKMLTWDPARRLTPEEGFNHPWIVEGLRELNAGTKVPVIDSAKNVRSKSLPQNVRKAKEVPALPHVPQAAQPPEGGDAPDRRSLWQHVADPASGRKSGLVPARLPDLM